MQYRLSEKAAGDLEDILVEGILTFGELQALNYQDSFKRTFELLANMPTLGRKSERIKANEHRFLHGSHVIYYRIDPEEIVIENIIYGPIITDIWGDA
jgi:toxin ParE1/3/4